MFGSKFKICKIEAYEVIDSRGFPTVAAKVYAKNGVFAKAMVPSGASTGEREAVELRDGDKERFNGKGVLKAVNNVNTIIAPKVVGMDCRQQTKIDELMISLDGTPNKAKLGANAILAVSLAVAKLAAMIEEKPLYKYIRQNIMGDSSDSWTMPVPMLNVINGGAHADNTIDFQEFMFMPVGAKSLKEAVRMASECFHSLQSILKSKKLDTNKGDEGGFAPNLKNADEALKLMVEAVEKAGYKPGVDADVAFALDPATSELFDADKKTYTFEKALKAKILTAKDAVKKSEDMVKYWDGLCKKYPIISIEDGLAENDWDGFQLMVKDLGSRVQIVGDDLFCTNPKIVKEGISKGVANSVLIKVNQIGTLTETIETIKAAHAAGWTCVVSHRSGETEDTTIADIAVGLSTGQIKTGSMSRSERIAKYNRLIEIENELGSKAHYPGKSTFKSIK
ncbi:phosphopyruvate hydratase [Malacoplasma penetrans]|uniref:Enolase n=1 Tax=Malacoplasma penetrans (strain HF-2) TaxID=272633 RepID=ENO_MALP2|nr:phosphopyruvate hydratase [Malacoplasma penetrans]Q8EW32.1 RecName: Full=Enolase; AltName: Full=2-phospho-D-glycerate hydro-lyase; AltName: Full=2-phosphoglycerate dehydratase [Malacoplasma penetrans HF-2]RXY96372.1 phosphopyruvate hydratase [Malacoplasma penetrans]BAC44164.1 enolase [Malacoplasma penetrans HF-2]